MATRMSVIVFHKWKNEGCFSDHEVPDEEQKKKTLCLRRTPLRKA